MEFRFEGVRQESLVHLVQAIPVDFQLREPTIRHRPRHLHRVHSKPVCLQALGLASVLHVSTACRDPAKMSLRIPRTTGAPAREKERGVDLVASLQQREA